MPSAKPISKTQIMEALDKVNSVTAVGRYLGVSYIHIKKYMKLYIDEESGKTLFDKYKNPKGKGIPKFSKTKGWGKEPYLRDILEGRISAQNFDHNRLKYRLLDEGYLDQRCDNCGFCEHRISDYKVPLILNFKDKNKNNWIKNNIHMLCYNCFFLLVGEVFTEKDISQLETSNVINKTSEHVELELDEYQKERLKSLGLGLVKENNNDDPYSLVSYKE
jgi:hypothetical protein